MMMWGGRGGGSAVAGWVDEAGVGRAREGGRRAGGRGFGWLDLTITEEGALGAFGFRAHESRHLVALQHQFARFLNDCRAARHCYMCLEPHKKYQSSAQGELPLRAPERGCSAYCSANAGEKSSDDGEAARGVRERQASWLQKTSCWSSPPLAAGAFAVRHHTPCRRFGGRRSPSEYA